MKIEEALKQAVKKRSKGKDFRLRVGAVLCCLAVTGLFVYISITMPWFSLLAFAEMLVVLTLGVYLFARIKFEYEYCCDFKDVFSIDAVRGCRKNKRLVEVNVKNILEFGEFRESYIEQTRHDKFLDLTSDDETKVKYYATYRNEENQIVMFTFNPDEKMVRTIEKKYKRQY